MPVTMIADVVGSREVLDRRELDTVMRRAISRINNGGDSQTRPSTLLRITVGDEFQGAFQTLGGALKAALRLRIEMAPYDVRIGIGRGDVTVLSEEPRVEDGPGWWSARAAIERAARCQRKAATRQVRTVVAVDPDGSQDPAVAAALLLADQVISGLDGRDLSVLGGMLGGMSQREIADTIGITPSAVSQRVRQGGLGILLEADRLWGELP